MAKNYFLEVLEQLQTGQGFQRTSVSPIEAAYFYHAMQEPPKGSTHLTNFSVQRLRPDMFNEVAQKYPDRAIFVGMAACKEQVCNPDHKFDPKTGINYADLFDQETMRAERMLGIWIRNLKI